MTFPGKLLRVQILGHCAHMHMHYKTVLCSYQILSRPQCQSIRTQIKPPRVNLVSQTSSLHETYNYHCKFLPPPPTGAVSSTIILRVIITCSSDILVSKVNPHIPSSFKKVLQLGWFWNSCKVHCQQKTEGQQC